MNAPVRRSPLVIDISWLALLRALRSSAVYPLIRILNSELDRRTARELATDRPTVATGRELIARLIATVELTPDWG